MTWNQVYSGATPVSDEVLDFQKLSKGTLNKYATWDITRTVMAWYQKQNEGDTSGAAACSCRHSMAMQRAARQT